MTVHGSAQRAARIAWVCAGFALLFVAVRVAQGCVPDHFLSAAWIMGVVDDQTRFMAVLILPTAIWLALGFPALRLFGLACGRRRHTDSGERTMQMNSPEAEEFCTRAFAELIRKGFLVGNLEPLPDGNWRRSARKGWPLRTVLEIESRRNRLAITHRFEGLSLLDTGYREIQDWFLDRLCRGEPLESPPRQFDAIGATMFVGALLGAIGTTFFHFAPEEIREPWAPGVAVSTLTLLAWIPTVAALCYGAFGKKLLGKRILVPTLLVALSAGFLLLARPAAWESESWRTTEDPSVLCKAGLSAWYEGPEYVFPLPQIESRTDRAIQARVAIERRIQAMGSRAVPTLVRECADDRWRSRMIERLGPAAIEPTLALLDDPDPAIRRRAADALDDLPIDARVDEAAVRCLSHPDVEMRLAAANHFESSWGPCHPALHSALDDPDWRVQARAHSAIKARRCQPIAHSPRSVEALLELADSSHYDVSGAAIALLARSGDERGIARAVRELRRCFEVLQPLYRSGHASIDDVLFWIDQFRYPSFLDHRDQDAAAAIEVLIRDESRVRCDRKSALATLRRISPERSARCAEDLQWFIPELSTERLLAGLEDPDTRSEALDALRRKGDAAATLPLLRRLRQSPSAEDREALLRVLVELPHVDDLESRKQFRKLLEEAQEAGDQDEICRAATALATAGDPQVIPLLRRIIRYPHLGGDWSAAVASLGHLGDEGARNLIEILEEDDSLRCRALIALGRTKSALALPVLTDALARRNLLMRKFAAEGLGHLDDPRAVPLLLRTIEQDLDWVVRGAVWALQKITQVPFGVLNPDEDVGDCAYLRERVRAWASK